MKVLHDIRWPEMLYETEEDAGASVKAIDDEMKPLIQPLRIHHKSVFHQQQQGANNQGANVHNLESSLQLLFPPQILPSTHVTKSPLSHNWLSPNAFTDYSGSSSACGFFDTRSSTHSWSMQGQNDNIELSNGQQQRVRKPSRFVRHAHSNKTAAAQNKKHNGIHGQNQTRSMSVNPSYNSVQATTSRGSHMPALFLRCSGSHDEKAIGGTGVFLPHYYIGNGSKHKRKSGTKFLQLFSSVFSAQQLYILQPERIHPTFPVVLKTLCVSISDNNKTQRPTNNKQQTLKCLLLLLCRGWLLQCV